MVPVLRADLNWVRCYVSNSYDFNSLNCLKFPDRPSKAYSLLSVCPTEFRFLLSTIAKDNFPAGVHRGRDMPQFL